ARHIERIWRDRVDKLDRYLLAVGVGDRVADDLAGHDGRAARRLGALGHSAVRRRRRLGPALGTEHHIAHGVEEHGLAVAGHGVRVVAEAPEQPAALLDDRGVVLGRVLQADRYDIAGQRRRVQIDADRVARAGIERHRVADNAGIVVRRRAGGLVDLLLGAMPAVGPADELVQLAEEGVAALAEADDRDGGGLDAVDLVLANAGRR